jgi:L-asparaginase II
VSPPLVEVTRTDRTAGNDEVESVHHGALVVVGPDGEVVGAIGDVERRIFVRSSVKPFQAAACLALLAISGPRPSAQEIAVACASHRAEPRHLDAVRRLLERSGTRPDVLTCPPAAGLDDPTPRPVRIRHNCSGKHAMFALAGAEMGAHRDTFLDPDGPLQSAILPVLHDALGPTGGIAIDGCGAPAVAVPLLQLARGYTRLAVEDRWSAVRDAMLAHPGLVGGEGRAETALLEEGVIAKPGAEGVFAASFTDARGGAYGIAVKALDGASRASATVMVGLLEAWGIVPLGTWRSPAPTGGGRPVGEVRVTAAVRDLATQLPRLRRSHRAEGSIRNERVSLRRLPPVGRKARGTTR